jgi:hypothetical protein
MGLIDEATATAMDGLNETVSQFNQDGNVGKAIEDILGYSLALDGIPTVIPIQQQIGQLAEQTSRAFDPGVPERYAGAMAGMWATGFWPSVPERLQQAMLDTRADVEELRVAYEELPDEVLTTVEVDNENDIFTTLYGLRNLVGQIEGQHRINFTMGPAGNQPVEPAQPVPPSHNFQSGTDYAPGGWSEVGELGPEMMYVPTGSTVVSHQEAFHANAGGGTQNFNLTVNTTRELFSVRHEFEVMSAMGGQ